MQSDRPYTDAELEAGAEAFAGPRETTMPTEDDLRRASTEALLERHVGEPLREITGELMTEVAERIAAALADLRQTERRCRTLHYSDCLCGALAARTIATLTGEEPDRG